MIITTDYNKKLAKLVFYCVQYYIRKTNRKKSGSLSTVVGDEKLTSRENLIGFLFLYVQSDENTLPKVNKVSKTEAQTFDVFDKLIGPLQFCI